MSALLRASLRQVSVRRGVAPRRMMSSGPEKGWHIPFDYFSSKTSFAVKLTSFVALGFSIPFIASVYQLRKAGGA
ncbi:hypothetical protein BC835DRAFT_1412934 [Cytidiella melzeri]|nr:hypothetical protein BC835DRAFT_1412934 [Cytidiella melzeri]